MTSPDLPGVATGDEPTVSSLFCVETSDPFDSYTYRLESISFSGRTGYQSVVIAKTYNYGLALFLDGQIQSAEDDEALYHELLVQPAMLRHPSPKDVLILGGGEGATLREVLVHGSVRTATMVDLDGELVDLCRQYLETFHMGCASRRPSRPPDHRGTAGPFLSKHSKLPCTT